MPIKKPGKRPFAPWLKEHKALKGGGGKKTGVADLLLTPLIDMFVILVVFLIMNFSSTGELPIAKGVTLPKASVTQRLEQATTIDITDDTITLGGNRVADTDDVRENEDLRIPDLTSKLQELRKIEEGLNPGQPFEGNLIINCDKDIDFKIVRKVMFAAADAGYTNVNYAVRPKKAEGAEGEGAEGVEG
jgi:biopolymer transport protein ExbD